MKVLLVEPEKFPRAIEIGDELKDLQEAVGGNIEAIYPFKGPVALIVNEEGKLNGLPLNRALRDDDCEIYDVIAGNFLVVGLAEDSFCSLTDFQLELYEIVFHSPQRFRRILGEFFAVPIPDDEVET